jgi:hypothetical protein
MFKMRIQTAFMNSATILAQDLTTVSNTNTGKRTLNFIISLGVLH